MLDTGKHPGQLKDSVASAGGTTIAGLHELEKVGECFRCFARFAHLILTRALQPVTKQGAFRGSVMSCVVAASNRATELAKPDSKL